MSPPLRSATDRAALIEALADGTIDCIGTDHAPHRGHEKEQPFAQAPNGVIGLETAFSAVYTHLVEPGLVPLATVVERMSAGPAAAFGLPRPARSRGEAANLSLWDLGASWLVQPPYASRSTNCAFAGQTLRARCHLTIAAGSVAHRLIEAVRVVPAFLVLEDGTVYRGRPVRRPRDRGRRARLHDVDDRLPGGGHRSQLRGPARHLHPADDRELRRRARRPRSRTGRTPVP